MKKLLRKLRAQRASKPNIEMRADKRMRRFADLTEQEDSEASDGYETEMDTVTTILETDIFHSWECISFLRSN